MNRKIDSRGLFNGLMLIAIGILFLLDQLHIEDFGDLIVKYAGDRYLNKRNTALAPGFATVNIGVGYRVGRCELRLERRQPVAVLLLQRLKISAQLIYFLA